MLLDAQEKRRLHTFGVDASGNRAVEMRSCVFYKIVEINTLDRLY
jgi:hypothetical protein